MHRGRVSPARSAQETAVGIVPKSFRLKRAPALRPAEHVNLVRYDSAFCEDDRGAPRTRTPGARRGGHGEKSPPQKGLHRLEPERGPQDDGWRVLAPGQTRPALYFDAGKMERAPESENRGAPIRAGCGAQAIEETRRPLRPGFKAETKIAAPVCGRGESHP